MSRSLPATRLRADEVRSGQEDNWRLERMRSLVADVDLPGEWDPERLLVVPQPGGRLTGRDGCLVAECPKPRCGARPLCDSHVSQFARSGLPSLEEWLAAGPHPIRLRTPLEGCVVTGVDGTRCARPMGDPQQLCEAHSVAWHVRRRRGVSFEEFLASARPFPGFGPCAAASCFLDAVFKQFRLCRVHYVAWIGQGRPSGRRFEVWAARVRQPISGRILSLRGLPELVRLEVLYGIWCRVGEQMATEPWQLRRFVDLLRASSGASVTVFDVGRLRGYDAYARFVIDRVVLAYADPDTERGKDRWDLRLFGHRGHLDFTGIRQTWLREAVKAWAATALTGVRSAAVIQRRVQSMSLLSSVLASGPGAGKDPAALGRADVDRFLLRLGSLRTKWGEPYGARRIADVIQDAAVVLREAREQDLLPALPATFAFSRGDSKRRPDDDEPGRALPVHVVAVLDAHLDLLRSVPGSSPMNARRVLGDRAGEMAVLIYQLLKGTGRRAGEIASLHLDCLDTGQHGRPVLVYDNHKRQRMARRLPLSDSELVVAIRAQQSWVTERFPDTPANELWLLPQPTRNSNGRAHVRSHLITMWIAAWVARIPDIASQREADETVPFDRSAIHPHAFRHTYAQTLADQGVPAPVLRDLMDHRSIDTTMGYYKVRESRKREAMEVLARHTIDNRGVTRPVEGEPSSVTHLREHLSWVAVPMGKCSEPTNVRAGGQACPIRYQCAGCPHFESDPSYLPELRAYADDLRKEREAMLADGAADWTIEHVGRQLKVIVGHIHTHEALLDRLARDERAVIEDASATLRKARQSVPVAFGRRRNGRG